MISNSSYGEKMVVIVIMLRQQRVSDMNKTKRGSSLKKLNLEKWKEVPPLQVMGSQRQEVTLNSVMDEVLKHLIEIIETLLQEENSNNYISFMKRNQEMYEQLEKKMANLLNDRMVEIRCEFMAKVQALRKAERKRDMHHQLHRGLKNERKAITQSIISIQRTSSLNLHLPQQRSQQFLKMGSQGDLAEVGEEDEKTLVNSFDMNSVSAKLSDLQLQHSKNMKELVHKFDKRIEENCCDLKKLAEKHVEFKLKFQQKFESNLQSLWNVISEVQLKVDQLETVTDQLKSKR